MFFTMGSVKKYFTLQKNLKMNHNLFQTHELLNEQFERKLVNPYWNKEDAFHFLSEQCVKMMINKFQQSNHNIKA